MNNTKLLAVIAFAITFLLGGVSGFMLAPVELTAEKQTSEVSESEEKKEKLTYEEFQSKMIEDLNLTEEQQEPIFDKIKENRRANRQVINEYHESMKEELRENYNQFLDELSDILDSEQLDQFKEYYGRDALRRQRRN